MKTKQTSVFPKKNSSFYSQDPKVGIINPGYGYERVSYALNLPDFEYKRLYTLPIYRVMGAHAQFYRETPIVVDFGIDLLHTWNSLPISRKPFVVSFECELPRYLGNVVPWQAGFGEKILRSKRCRRILALSEAARNRFAIKCENLPDDGLMNKVEVFRGGVSLPILAKGTYSNSGPLKILFVGTDAVRKGIVPLFNTCDKLVQQGLDLKLTFIGGFNEQCYVHGEHIPDVNEVETRLRQAKWVDYKGRVAVDSVFNQMTLHDILAFPTFDESLGWVPIEAGMLGVPTIATDIFAIPELIEHQNTGYLIAIDKRSDRRFIGLDTAGDELAEHLDKANKNIENGLKTVIEDLYSNRDKIEQWGRAAKLRLSTMYSPESAKNQLTKIYNDALDIN